MQFGRCFEEFEIGAIYKHWPGRTITEYDDTLFCMLTMNHNPLHIDAHYAETRQHGQRLVAGPLRALSRIWSGFGQKVGQSQDDCA